MHNQRLHNHNSTNSNMTLVDVNVDMDMEECSEDANNMAQHNTVITMRLHLQNMGKDVEDGNYIETDPKNLVAVMTNKEEAIQ